MKPKGDEIGSPYSPPQGPLAEEQDSRGWGSRRQADLLAFAWLLLVGRSFYVLLFFEASGTPGHDALDNLGEFLAAALWPLVAALVAAVVRGLLGGRGTPFRFGLVGATLLLPMLVFLALEIWSSLT